MSFIAEAVKGFFSAAPNLEGMHTVELVAPAGKLAHVEAVIAAGADAVYVGPRRMSGRPSHAELSVEEVGEARAVTAALGKKLYVAINAAMAFDDERRWRETLDALEAAAPDAFIAGSWDVIRLLGKRRSAVPLHGSSFLGIYNTEGLELLKEKGARRVILGTSLTIGEIEDLLRSERELQFEIIAYGGLCFNDGYRCALPHRPPRRCDAGDTGRDSIFCHRALALLDGDGATLRQGRLLWNGIANLAPRVHLLRELGITAFKVEGRQRSLDFILEGVRALRVALDAPAPPGTDHYFSPLWRRRPKVC